MVTTSLTEASEDADNQDEDTQLATKLPLRQMTAIL